MTEVQVALALVLRGGRWFLQRRDPASDFLPGRWEFPGGKVEPGESPEDAARRELCEETGLVALRLEALPAQVFTYPDRQVRLHPFRIEAEGLPHTGLAWGWFTPAEASRLPQPEANRLLEPLMAGLPG